MSDFMTAEDALLLANQYTDEHGGGGGGTTNYNSLSNRPQINGTTLSGNKTGHQLGLQNELTFDNVPTQSSNNPVKSGGIYSALAEKVTAEAGKVLSSNDYTTAEKTKLAGIEAGAEVNVIEKIVLNGVELVPANKEVAINVITRAVNNLTNYYLKSETYTKTEVDDLISAMASLTLEIVQTLPVSDISTTTIYLVPVQGQTNVYMQYAYINNDWAQLGTTQVDLTNYYTKTQVDTLLAGKEDTLTFDSAPTASSDNPVTSGGVYTALAGKQDTLTFDNAPTENSNNPVKSGGVYTALSNKQDTLEFDTEPTVGSTKMVTSGAIATALDNVQPAIATDQSVGVVKPDGTTITIDNDGTIHGSSGIQPDEADFTFDQGLLSLNADRRYFHGTPEAWEELNSADKALYKLIELDEGDISGELRAKVLYSHTADGTKTYSQEWDALFSVAKNFALNNSVQDATRMYALELSAGAGDLPIICKYVLDTFDSVQFCFVRRFINAQRLRTYYRLTKESGSVCGWWTEETSGVSHENTGSQTFPNGSVLMLCYV